MKPKGWRGESRRHSMARKGVSTADGVWKDIRKIKKEKFEKSKKFAYEDGIKKILNKSGHKFSEVIVSSYIIDELYYHFKDNKNKYEIEKISIMPSKDLLYLFASFYIKWNNGNITKINSPLISAPIEKYGLEIVDPYP